MRALIATAAVVSSLATPAYAACVQSDFAGRWATYFRIFPQLEQPASWVRCQLDIQRGGDITNTSCRASGAAWVRLTEGRIRLANNRHCAFTGKFKLERDSFVIEHMTLAMDKLTANGVGTTTSASVSKSMDMASTRLAQF